MSYVFVCSTHGFIDDFSQQKKVLDKIKPRFVLCEDLEDHELVTDEDFEAFLKRKFVSDMTDVSEVEALVRYCYKKRIKLIGIDFPNFGFDEELQKKIKNQTKLTDEEEKTLDALLKKREEHHLKKIKEHPDSVIILGSWHLREGSLIRRRLVDVVVYGPLDENGHLVFEPKRFCEFGKLS